MSIDLTINNLRETLSDKRWILEDSFTVLSTLSLITNNSINEIELENEARELVIRTLEYRPLLCEEEKNY